MTREDAFALLWRRALPAVRAIVANSARSDNDDERADLVQLVAVKTWLSFDPERLVVPFVVRLAERVCVDRHRIRARSTEKAVPLDENAILDPSTSPEQRSADRSALEQALRLMTRRERFVVRAIAGGKTHSEIGARLSVSPTRVHQIFDQARKKALTCLVQNHEPTQSEHPRRDRPLRPHPGPR